MRIQLICPAPPGTLHGNRVTAARWARILRSLGHRVQLRQHYRGESCDLLVALHARRSADAAFRFHRACPDKPLLVALTGTDLYRDIRQSRRAQQLLELATGLVVLQPLGRTALPARLRSKVHVLYQSAIRTRQHSHRRGEMFFPVSVVGHLRRIKDPFRTALASRLLPPGSRIRVWQAGMAMERGMASRTRAEERRNPRYRWLGELSYGKARRLIASSRLLVLSSLVEGGANVISEAVVDQVPVLASRIPGSIGLLGRNYPGYFPVRDTRALARLLSRVESDPRFYAQLRSWAVRLAPRFRPSRERAQWKKLLIELGSHPRFSRSTKKQN